MITPLNPTLEIIFSFLLKSLTQKSGLKPYGIDYGFRTQRVITFFFLDVVCKVDIYASSVTHTWSRFNHSPLISTREQS